MTAETTTRRGHRRTASRWMGVGRSSDPDAARAGAAAATGALNGDDPGLLSVFCWDGYDLPQLLAGVRAVAAGVPLIGCSTAGEITAGGPGDAGVVVTALGGPGWSVPTAAAEVVAGDFRAAGMDATGCTDQVGPQPHRFVLLLSDGLSGDQEEIVRGAYARVGATLPLVGGCAGDGLKMQGTFQLHGDRVLRRSVVAAAIASDAPIGIGVRHGWRRVGSPAVVTGSAGSRVSSLEDRPAPDVCLERLDATPAVRAAPAAFTAYASTHPLGLARRSGEQVRCVAEADFPDRSLGCIAHVPRGGLAWLMEGDDQSILDATDAACGEALAALATPPLGLLVFDRIARRGILGHGGGQQEVARLAALGGQVSIAGFYTCGQFARVRGSSGFHNQTLALLARG